MAAMVKEAQVLYDAHGRKTHVLLPFKKYEELLERLEDREDIKLIREVAHQKSIPWSEVKKRLRKNIPQSEFRIPQFTMAFSSTSLVVVYRIIHRKEAYR